MTFGLVVPAYFHPGPWRSEWDALTRHARKIRVVVLNIASGPGEVRDDAFVEPVTRLREAGVRVAGYVDTAYGERSNVKALLDFDWYRERYGVDGVFFDRVPTGSEHVHSYAALAATVRLLGAEVVAFNHGAYPGRDYAEHADLLGTFEGPWSSYVELESPRWVRARPPSDFFHLVHSVPPERVSNVLALAERRNVSGVYATEHTGPNPWGRLPSRVFDFEDGPS